VADDEPRLEWGRLAAFDPICAEQMPADLVRCWQVAQESLGLAVRPIERFELTGTLNSHPGHVRSDEAKQPFGAILALAVASRTAAGPLRTGPGPGGPARGAGPGGGVRRRRRRVLRGQA
jgi:hypothetical protein